MHVYMIVYNVRGNSRKFRDLQRLVEQCCYDDCWLYYIDNTWFLKSELSADELGQKINSITHHNDAFIVVEVVNNFACWLPEDALDYLQNILFD